MGSDGQRSATIRTIEHRRRKIAVGLRERLLRGASGEDRGYAEGGETAGVEKAGRPDSLRFGFARNSFAFQRGALANGGLAGSERAGCFNSVLFRLNGGDKMAIPPFIQQGLEATRSLDEPSTCTPCNKKDVIRIVPFIQIRGHDGIFSYVEKIDGSTFSTEIKSLKFEGTPAMRGWIALDKKRIYFIPGEIPSTTRVYLDDNPYVLEREISSSDEKRHCIDSMKAQMKMFKEFLKENKDHEVSNYNVHTRYWKVLAHIETLLLKAEDEKYLLSAIREIKEA